MSGDASTAVPLTATYRLQFNASFRFEDATRILPYLASLGVSHVYASPLLMARPGSTHGYDIVDHNRLNPELGEPADFDRFVATLRRHGLGLILDFVPNHMGIGPDNPWWMDVLEWGPTSPYAGFFDIDWQPPERTLAGKVLLPVLGEHYGAALARGDIRLMFDDSSGSFSFRYGDAVFPVRPADYPRILADAAGRGTGGALFERFVPALRECLRGGAGRWRRTARRERVAQLRTELARGMASDDAAKRVLTELLDELNGTPGRKDTFDALHRLLERQYYRLAFWRVAAHEINYRRFFDVNDLASLRMENRRLFDATHGFLERLLRGGKIDGIRLDHIDGLRAPGAYLRRLRKLATEAPAERQWAKARRRRHIYLYVEKILAAHERLRGSWPVDGTTGYDFLADVNGLFVDPAAESYLNRVYLRFAGRYADFESTCVDAKRQVMRESLAAELQVLANLFNRIAKQSRDTRDYSMAGLQQALADIIAHFPVYRTYVTPGNPTADDRPEIDTAVRRARKAARAPDLSIYEFIRSVLTLDILRSSPEQHQLRDVVDAALEFQQYTGPVMAKAVEDTAFYRYVRLVSLNEVGGKPDRFAVSPVHFHERNVERAATHPLTMLATATHDHKRGEDLRARLNVLSEVPHEWARRVRSWSRLNEPAKAQVNGHAAPSRNDEYLLYQTIVGAWPYGLDGPGFRGIDAFRERLDSYMQKAAREAKLATSWASPDEAYERALSAFVAAILDPERGRAFLEQARAFVERIAAAGAVNGLAQAVLKLTSPGVPDLYQGTELWDLSLVDPDNRRPVDYRLRRRSLAADGPAFDPALLLGHWRDGRIKQHVIHRILRLRRERPALFEGSKYRAVAARGAQAARVLAFARTGRAGEMLVIVPRRVWSLLQPGSGILPVPWDDTDLVVPEGGRPSAFHETLTGREISLGESGSLRISDLLSRLPIAVLVRNAT